MEEFMAPLPENHTEIDDEEIVMPDTTDFMKNVTNPYKIEDGSGVYFTTR